MGSKKSGNRTPREKKDYGVKSRLFQFRLHPEDAEEAWAMDRVAYYMQRGFTLRRLFVEALAALDDVQLPERSVIATSEDVARTRQAVEWLVEQVQSGAFSAPAGGRGKRIKEKIAEAPKQIQEMLHHYMDGGLTIDDVDDAP